MVLNKGQLLLFSFLFLFSGCELFDYHPYDGRLINAERDVNSKNILRIEAACQNKDTIRFVMMGDTQGHFDETEKFVKHVNKRNDIDYVIHGGDMADFGLKKEFQWNHEIMSKLNVPYVALIGNHDIIGNGDDVYREMYGDENFSFIAGDIKFVCLNTNAIEYDYSYPVPDFTFIKNEIDDISRPYSRTVVVMHAPPGNEQFNNNVKDVFHEYILRFPSLQFCLHAHVHAILVEDIFDDGMIYYGCSNIAKRNYLLFTLTPDHYEYEVVYF